MSERDNNKEKQVERTPAQKEKRKRQCEDGRKWKKGRKRHSDTIREIQ